MAENITWNLLLIDDDEDDYILTRNMLQELRSRKARLTWASTFNEGRRQIIEGGPFDAVLVDYDLGGWTGLDLVRQIEPSRLAFPVVLLTGRGSYEVDVEAMQAGVSLYLTKDEVNPLLLERGIRYAIEMKQHERVLQLRAARLQLLSDVAAELLRSRDPVDLLDEVSRRLTELAETDVYVHYQVAPHNSHLDLAAIGGYSKEVREQLNRLEFGQAVCGTVARTCRPIIVQHVQQSDEPMTSLIRDLGITAYACHPLIVHGRLFGTLSFGSRTRAFLDPETIDLMRTVCDLMALAFERRETEHMKLSEEGQKFFTRVSEKARPIKSSRYHP